ncbi:MAG: MATE family efflux transporter [Candidatus Nanohaloarchaea archaeon]
MVLGKIFSALEGIFRSKEELDLTGGPVKKNLFYLSLPVVMINLLQTAYNLADTFWLGQFSQTALEAITFAFPLIFLLVSFGLGISVAGSVLVAQLEGSGKKDRRNYAASQTLAFAAIGSLVLGGLGYFFIGEIVGMMGASGATATAATNYLEIVSLGIFAFFGFIVFQSLMRGYGDTLTPMVLMFGTVVLNVVLDPVMIFGWGPFPRMGVTGAAYATIFSRMLALSIGLWMLFTGRRGIQVSLEDMRPDMKFFRKMLAIGVPASIEGGGRATSVNLLVAIVGIFFSGTVVAGYGIGVRIFSMVFLPATAVGRAVESMTGQNIGAGEFDRAARTARAGALYSFLLLEALGVLTFLFAEPIASVFTTEQDVAMAGASFLRIVSLSFGCLGIQRAYTGSFRGAGKTVVAGIISVGALGVVRLPIAYYSALEIGVNGVWAAFFISNVAGAAVSYLWYRKGTWKQRITDQGNGGEASGESRSRILYVFEALKNLFAGSPSGKKA